MGMCRVTNIIFYRMNWTAILYCYDTLTEVDVDVLYIIQISISERSSAWATTLSEK